MSHYWGMNLPFCSAKVAAQLTFVRQHTGPRTIWSTTLSEIMRKKVTEHFSLGKPLTPSLGYIEVTFLLISMCGSKVDVKITYFSRSAKLKIYKKAISQTKVSNQ